MLERLWVLVLAAGEGSRVRHLTTDASGRGAPKQYASFNGQASMLRRTLDRAERVVPRDRVAVVVARSHERFWARELADLPPWNIIVQPRDRGTGLGLLLGLLHIQLRAPGCGLLVLPSDHHVVDEDALRESLLRAIEHAGQSRGRPTLLGVTPEGPDGGLGWIRTAKGAGRDARDVVGFVEKPDPAAARRLAQGGALVNSMILAADGKALLSLFLEAAAPAVGLLREHLSAGGGRADSLDTLYEALPTCDFSRDILEREAGRLGVVAARPCGWTDIGTPDRLSRVLGHGPHSACVA